MSSPAGDVCIDSVSQKKQVNMNVGITRSACTANESIICQGVFVMATAEFVLFF